MSAPASYKPSPLSFGSPQRASPFRRPESPASPSPLRNSTTPVQSSSKSAITPGRLDFQLSPNPSDGSNWTPRGMTPSKRVPELSPTKGAPKDIFGGPIMGAPRGIIDTHAMSKLQPGQVRELREGFQILDRDGDGSVCRDDVADMLNQLGLPSGPADVAPFFPVSQPQTLSLPAFLTSISTLLSSLSPPSELLSAFSAFDDDDSGQIDLAELRDALLLTAPEPGDDALTEREVDKIINGFSGRRAFAKTAGLAKRGEVFKYQEFVSAIAGGGVNEKENRAENI